MRLLQPWVRPSHRRCCCAMFRAALGQVHARTVPSFTATAGVRTASASRSFSVVPSSTSEVVSSGGGCGNDDYDDDDDDAAVAKRWEFSGNVSWFPGHMARGTREVEEQLRDVNAIVEVRDARIPFSSRNPRLSHLLERKNRIVVLNKADLADPALEQATAARIVQEEGASRGGVGQVSVVYTSCHAQSRRNLGKVVPRLVDGMKLKFNTLGGLILVLGVPNVGKSTIINTIRRMTAQAKAQGQGQRRQQQQMGGRPAAERTRGARIRRKSKAAVVGALPGVTKSVSKVQVWDQPTMFMMDSPGIMYPRIDDSETALKLTLTGAIKDSIVGDELLAEYLLHQLNRHGPGVRQQYADVLGLPTPTSELRAVLAALGSDAVGNVNACRKFLRLYRSGALGRFCLDDCHAE